MFNVQGWLRDHAEILVQPQSPASGIREYDSTKKGKQKATLSPKRSRKNRNRDPENESLAAKYDILFDEDIDQDIDYESRQGKPSERHWLLRWSLFRKRFPYYVPILLWLPNYSLKRDLPMDIIAGIAVAAMLIPQSLAMALLAGLPPQYGLYTAWITPIIYCIMGSSKQMSVGPETVVSILVGLTIKDVNPEDPIAYSFVLAFFVGLFLFLMGIFRFGFIDSILSRPLMVGFINAVAIMIIIEQLDVLLGVPNPEIHSVISKLQHIFGHLSDISDITVGIGIASIVFLFGTKILKYYCAKVKPPQIQKSFSTNSAELESGESTVTLIEVSAFQQYKYYLSKAAKLIPDVLCLLIIMIFVTYAADIARDPHAKEVDVHKLAILGDIPQSFPTPYPPKITSISILRDAIQPAIVIGILGFLETVIVAKHYAEKHNYQSSPNRELVAIGMMNMVGSCFKAYPAFGSFTRSAVADAAGARTPIYQLVVSVIILLTILVVSPLFYYLPKVVLAAILIVAATGLFELHDVRFLWRIKSVSGLILLVITFLLTLLLGVELGLLISLGISVFMVVKHTTIPNIAIIGRVPGTDKYRDMSMYDSVSEEAPVPVPGILMIRIEESLYFANIGQIKEMLIRIEKLGSFDAHPVDLVRQQNENRDSIDVELDKNNSQEPLPTSFSDDSDSSSSSSSPKPIRGLFGIVFDSRNIYSMDASAVQTLSEMCKDYRKRGVQVCFVKLRDVLKSKFMLAGIIDSLGGDQLFTRNSDAVSWLTSGVSTHSTYI